MSFKEMFTRRPRHETIFRGYKVKIKDGLISYKKEGPVPVAGIKAEIETSGEIHKRMSATRVLTGGVILGPFGAILGGISNKKKDKRNAFLIISSDTFVWAVEFSPEHLNEAHKFCAQLNNLSKLRNQDEQHSRTKESAQPHLDWATADQAKVMQKYTSTPTIDPNE